MSPLRPERFPTRHQPRRAAGPPKPVYIPDAMKNKRPKKKGIDKTDLSKRDRQGRKPRSRHYSFDSLLGEGSGDPLRRLDRWIPQRGQRPQPMEKPPHVPDNIWVAYCALDDWMYDQTGELPGERAVRPQPVERPDGVLISLWLSYCNLDDYVYRHWLTQNQVLALPLADDVDDYRSGLRKEQPITPSGFKWIGTELKPINAYKQAAQRKGAERRRSLGYTERGDIGKAGEVEVRQGIIDGDDEHDYDDGFLKRIRLKLRTKEKDPNTDDVFIDDEE